MEIRIQKSACLLLTLTFPIAAFADITSTAALSTGSTLNLDSGTTGTSGGDLLWNVTDLTPQGSATALNLGSGGASFYASVTEAALQQASAGFSKTPMSNSSLKVNDVLGVHTNGGHYAKLLITAKGGGVLTLEYTSYGAGGGGAGAPTITQVQNNYSYILPDLPNYGIAPGSLFIVKGSNLNDQPLSSLQSSAPPGLSTALNGTSISVTVNGTTTKPGIYYTSPGQLAAVLPSNTPTGTGTIIVTNGVQASAPAPIQVVESALGLDTYYGAGTGLAVAEDANYNLFSLTSSASPGQTIILWGSGVGADTTNDDKTYPLKQNNLTAIPMQVWIGGIQAFIVYRGRSQFPGVDQVVVTIPANVPTGCAVSIVAVSGSVVSNSVSLPVAPGGGTCSDPNAIAGAGVLQTLGGKSIVRSGSVDIAQSTSAGRTASIALAAFSSESGSTFVADAGTSPSAGSCLIHPQSPLSMSTGLDAGTISVSGPGVQATLNGIPQIPGMYSAVLPSLPSNGGAFTFTGSGGKDVGSFTANANFPVPLVWTNPVTAINRAQGQSVTWTGGAPGTYVTITGLSSMGTGLTLTNVSFFCVAPVGAGQFTVPSWVLLALPASSNGSFGLFNYSNPLSFTASGLDVASGVGFTSAGSNPVSYQ